MAGVALPGVSAVAETSVGPPCPMEPLAIPAGTQRAEVKDSDPTGRFQVGIVADSQFTNHLYRWVDGIPEDLGTAHIGAAGINTHGDIVGSDFDAMTSRNTAWRYHDGQFTDLPAENPGDDSFATGISDDGTVSGSSIDTGTSPRVIHPVTWDPSNVIRSLPLPAGDDSGSAEDIDNDGTIVGRTASGSGPARPVRWRTDGTIEWLALPDPGSSVVMLSTRGGWVVGTEISDMDDSEKVLRWSADSSAPETVGQGEAEAVSQRGSVAMRIPPDFKVWLLQDGVLRSLPTDSTAFPTGEVTALTNDDLAYGRWNSTPESWDCRVIQ